MASRTKLAIGILAFLVASSGIRAEDALRIGTITIVTEDVYTAEEAARGQAYEIVNTLHVQTRESVVRKMLLFREGEPFVASRLAESERNLRALGFIQSAKVTASEPHDGIVDVTVVTQDSWSTEPGGTIGSSGGDASATASVRETNLLGLGKELTVEYASDPERTGFGIRYEDPAAFGRYWRGEVAYADNSDGRQARLFVQRPFYSFSTPWSVRAVADDQTMESRIYEDAVISSEFSEARRVLAVGFGRALAANDERAHRLSLGIQFDSVDFEPLVGGHTTTLPADREYRYLVADYEFAVNRFRKLNFVDRDMRYEDFRLGTQLNLHVGISPAAFGVSETTGLAGASVSRGFAVTNDAFLLGTLSWGSRIGAANRNEIAGLDVRYIQRRESLHPHAFVARISARRGNDLDAEKQFFADGETGLRAYRLYAFSGDSSLLINLEERVFLGRELWQVLSPGFALFVDAGNAATGSDAFDPGKLHFDAGFGLRIGASRTPRNIFRLDFAYAFDPDPLGREGWLVSFSGSQAF